MFGNDFPQSIASGVNARMAKGATGDGTAGTSRARTLTCRSSRRMGALGRHRSTRRIRGSDPGGGGGRLLAGQASSGNHGIETAVRNKHIHGATRYDQHRDAGHDNCEHRNV